MTSAELADLLNDMVMDDGFPDDDAISAEAKNALLLESLYQDARGNVSNLAFFPADSTSQGMEPIPRLAQDIRDYYGLTEGSEWRKACAVADEVASLKPDDFQNDIVRQLPENTTWTGKLVYVNEALDDFASYRMDNMPPVRDGSFPWS